MQVFPAEFDDPTVPRSKPPRPHPETKTRTDRRTPQRPAGNPPPDKTLRIAGLRAVAALFRKAPDRVLRLFYEDHLVPQVGDFCAALAKTRRPYRLVDSDELTRIAGTVLHGGIVAVAEPREVPALTTNEARQWATEGRNLVVLDGIGNPHNLGAIARTLAFFGQNQLLLSDHPAQAGLSDAAYRVAEGGLEYLQLRQVSHLPESLKQLQRSYRVLGTALGRGSDLETLGSDPRPVALVLGNEEEGLSRATLAACEGILCLAGSGQVQSLNVAATAAILVHALKVRKPNPATNPNRSPPRRPERRKPHP